MRGRCLGCRAPGPGYCGGCGVYIDDNWDGKIKGATMDRYGLFGVIAQEREVNERAMDYDEQNIGDSGDTLLYETNDVNEAKSIYEAGGFEKDGKWHVVTRYEDRVKKHMGNALSKEDFA